MIGPDGVALGFRFHPSDEELVGRFLHTIVVDGNPIHLTAPFDTVLNSEDLFGAKEPWEIWDEYGGDGLVLLPHLYFCCELKTVTKNGWKINRKVGCGGTWSEGPSSKTVCNSANPNSEEPMGRKRNLRYENSNTKHPHHAKWLLDEYSIFVPHGHESHQRNPNSKRKMNSKTAQPITSRFVILRLRKNDKTPLPAAKETRKRKHYTEEEIVIETSSTNKKMTSQAGGSCSTSSTPLPALSDALVFPNDDDYDLSNIDVDIETDISWDSNPSLFDNFDFGMLDYGGDLQLLQGLLNRPAQEEPAMPW